MLNKLLSYSTPFLLVVILVLQVFSFGGGSAVGGTTNYDQLDTTDGYSVDGTSIINGSGVWTGTITTSNAATFSGTLTSSGGLDVDAISYGSATTTVATSTSGSVLTAANVCDQSILFVNPDWSAYATTTLPTAASLIADCLDTVGDERTITLRNATAGSTSTTVIAGGTYATGTILLWASSTVPAAGPALGSSDYAVIRLQADTTGSVKAFGTTYK